MKRTAAFFRCNQESYLPNKEYYETNYKDSNIYVQIGGNTAPLKRLIHDCEKEMYDKVIFRSFSRISRNLVECVTILKRINALGVEILVEDEKVSNKNDSWKIVDLINF